MKAEKKTGPKTVRFDEGVYDRLMRFLKRARKTRSEVVEEAVHLYLQDRGA